MNLYNIQDRLRIIAIVSLLSFIFANYREFLRTITSEIERTFSLDELISNADASDVFFDRLILTQTVLRFLILISAIQISIFFFKSNRLQNILIISLSLIAGLIGFYGIFQYRTYYNTISQVDFISTQYNYGMGYYAMFIGSSLMFFSGIYGLYYFRKHGTLNYILVGYSFGGEITDDKQPDVDPNPLLYINTAINKVRIHPFYLFIAISSTIGLYVVKITPFMQFSFGEPSKENQYYTLSGLIDLNKFFGLPTVQIEQTELYINIALVISLIATLLIIIAGRFESKVQASYLYIISGIFSLLSYNEFNSYFEESGPAYWRYFDGSVTVSRYNGIVLIVIIAAINFLLAIISFLKFRPLIKQISIIAIDTETGNQVTDDGMQDPSYFNYNIIKFLHFVATIALFAVMVFPLMLLDLKKINVINQNSVIYQTQSLQISYNIREIRQTAIFEPYNTNLTVLEIFLYLTLISSIIGSVLLALPSIKDQRRISRRFFGISSALGILAFIDIFLLVRGINTQPVVLNLITRADKTEIIYGSGYYLLLFAILMNLSLLYVTRNNRSTITENDILKLSIFMESHYRANFQRNIGMIITSIIGIYLFRTLPLVMIADEFRANNYNHEAIKSFDIRIRGFENEPQDQFSHFMINYWLLTTISIIIQIISIAIILLAQNKRTELIGYSVSVVGASLLVLALFQIILVIGRLNGIYSLSQYFGSTISVGFSIGFYFLLIVLLLQLLGPFSEYRIILQEKRKLRFSFLPLNSQADSSSLTNGRLLHRDDDNLYPSAIENDIENPFG